MPDLAALESQLNQLILEGQALVAFERFYAEDIVMQENTAPPVLGKARARKLCDAVWNIEKLTDARKLRPLLQA